MSEDGFDFGPPPQRREVRRFEPPPWEREQFEQHAREQEERERIQREARRTDAENASQEAQAASAESGDNAPDGQAHDSGPSAAAQQGETKKPARPSGKLDEKQVELMMLELRAEEPPTLTHAWTVALGGGVAGALVGVVSAIWGAAALMRLGPLGVPGGTVLVIFGLAFAGIGGVVVFRTLKQRGVL